MGHAYYRTLPDREVALLRAVYERFGETGAFCRHGEHVVLCRIGHGAGVVETIVALYGHTSAAHVVTEEVVSTYEHVSDALVGGHPMVEWIEWVPEQTGALT